MAETQLLTNATTPEERLKILQDIVNQLSREEGLAAIHMISRRNDLLSTLPVELLGEILSYLPIFHPWNTLSRVCKRWNEVFLSDELLRLSLTEHWNTHEPADSARPTGDDSVRDKTHHIQAMRLGRPFSAAAFADCANTKPGPLLQQQSRAIALKGSHIAYVTESEREVVVRDLVSGVTNSFHQSAREKIQCIALTSKIFAFLSSSGKLYVHTLSTQDSPPTAVRLPSAHIKAVNADEFTVSMVVRSSSLDHESLLLYDHEKGKLKSFDVPTVSYVGVCMLVDSRKQHVDLFWSDSQSKPPNAQRLSVDHKRYSFDGKEVSSSSWHRPPMPRRTKKPFLLGDPHSTGRKGQFVFRTELIALAGTAICAYQPELRAYMLLCFDSNKAELYEHHFGHAERHAANSDYHDYNSLALWKDVEFRAEDNTLFTSIEQPLKQHEARYTRHRSRDIDQEGSSSWNDEDLRNFSILVNDSFLVAFGRHASIRVFCYEEGLKWEGTPLEEKKRERWRIGDMIVGTLA